MGNDENVCWEAYDFNIFITDPFYHIGMIASGGGTMPDLIKNQLKDMAILENHFYSLPDSSDIWINPSLESFTTTIRDKRSYLSSFEKISRKGVFAYDIIMTPHYSDMSYFLITAPLNPRSLKELDADIFNKIICLLDMKLGKENQVIDFYKTACSHIKKAE